MPKLVKSPPAISVKKFEKSFDKYMMDVIEKKMTYTLIDDDGNGFIIMPYEEFEELEQAIGAGLEKLTRKPKKKSTKKDKIKWKQR